MSEDFGLYYFDNSPKAPERLETLRRLFENERWVVLDWPALSTTPHFNMRLRFKGAGSVSLAPSPALTYVARALSKLPTSRTTLAAVEAIVSSVAAPIQDQTIQGLSVMLPDSRTIRIESNTIAVDNDYVVPIDAKSSDIEGLLVVQGLEYAFDRRIKFASVDNRGRYVGDAAEEYESFLDGLPPGLRQESGDLAIQTRSEGARRAWHLRSKHELDIAVVEHETGVEFLLVSVVTPVFVGLATNAIYDLTKWGLNKWLERRQSKVSKAPTFLEIERVRKDAVGSVLGSETIRIRAPVDDQTLRSTVERFMQVAPPER